MAVNDPAELPMHTLEAHELTVANLRARFEAAGTPADVIETHISSVLLAGDKAWKLKKPVDLGFLDFRDLEDRHRFCEEEIRLNSRLAPSVYLDVVPVTGSAEAPELGGDGPAFDWAVRMRRFPQDALLSRHASKHDIDPAWLEALAHRVAVFHGAIAPIDASEPYGDADRLIEPMRVNFDHLRELLDDADRLAQLRRLGDWMASETRRLRPVFERRKAKGFVRECHGDMHLRNMVLINDVIEVFDGIEFNEDFRWIDIQSDVAFLTMDLDHRGEPALGWHFLNAWLAETGDYEGLAVHRAYQVYRAMVRAKVDAIRACQPHVSSAERTEALDDCGVLLDLAEGYTAPRPPSLTVTCGVSGSGKTTVARVRAADAGLVHLRSDVERKRLYGLAARERSGSPLDGGIYTADASTRTYARLLELADATLRAGHGVIVDATFLARSQRAPFLALARRAGIPATILYCHAPTDVVTERVLARGDDASEADLSVVARQLERLEKPGDGEPVELVET